MKFDINATAPTIFSEQLSTVIDLFHQWNDCERAVMLFAVLRKVPFPITKLLQSVIDTSLQQAQSKEQAKILERNANCAKYINSLSEKYNRFPTTASDSLCFGASDRSIDNVDKYYGQKEEILHDILKMMPILTVGNDDARLAYLEFIPMTVRDATRRIVSSTLVQQLFCYVLIHPAFSTEDRGSVVKYLKDLETHISSTEPNLFLYRNGSSPTSEPTNPSTPSNWQAIAPPQSKSTETIQSSPWSSSHHLTPRYADASEYNCTQSASISATPHHHHLYHHQHHQQFDKKQDMSFDDNGEIVNDEDDTNKSNTKVGFNTLPSVTQHLIRDGSMFQKPRSNSLTTTPSPNLMEKPARSPSLHGISTLNYGGSFDMSILGESSSSSWSSKPIPPQFLHNHHIGMRNINQWLKSLRLHKYVFLFAHQTYEQMLDITEDHLMDVTKGARNKIVSSIQKLKERYAVLLQVEKDWQRGQVNIAEVLDILTNIVLTPMKPIEPFNKQDVASQFLKVLDLVSTEMTAKLHIVPQDEEHVNSLMWILEKAVNNEAFVTHTNLLRDHRYNMQRIKNQFPPPPKVHYSKSNATSAPSIHRQSYRPRPFKLQEFLPPSSPFNRINNRPVSSSSSIIDQGLSFSAVTKYPEQPYFYGKEQSYQPSSPAVSSTATSDDKFTFKIPQEPIASSVVANTTAPATTTTVTTTPFRARTISDGSIESFLSASSGYQSDNNRLNNNCLSRSANFPIKSTPFDYQTDGGGLVGMNNIRKWLKSLRLHKYTWVFDNVSYEKMFTFTEDYLKGLAITQGASHKLAGCIEKLKTRAETMKQVELSLSQNRMFVPDAIREMETMVLSPMKPLRSNCETDVGYQLWKVINLVFNLLSSNNYDEATVQSFIRIVESSIGSEAFQDNTCTLRDMRNKLGRLGRRMIR